MVAEGFPPRKKRANYERTDHVHVTRGYNLDVLKGNDMDVDIEDVRELEAELAECQRQRDALAEALKELYNLSLYSHQGFDSKNCPVCAALDKAQAALAMLDDTDAN